MNLASVIASPEHNPVFQKSDTACAKGVALLLLLFCHLFNNRPELSVFWNDLNITQHLVDLSNVCVAMFVFLSGYGLNESTRIAIGLKKFYLQRLTRLYMNYWFIWLIFVPIGIFVFGRSMESVYGDHVFAKTVLNLLGVHFIFAIEGYNASWWYLSLIIPFIFIFPMVRELVRKFGAIFLFLSFLSLTIVIYPLKLPYEFPSHINLDFFPTYFFIFTLGVYMSDKQLFSVIVTSKPIVFRWLAYLLTLTFFVYSRFDGIIFFITHSRADGFIAFVLILGLFEISQKAYPVKKVLMYIGDHLFNIFLFHAFFSHYYFASFTYSYASPVVTYILFLAICMLVSIGLERLKHLVKFNPIYNKVRNMEVRESIYFGGY